MGWKRNGRNVEEDLEKTKVDNLEKRRRRRRDLCPKLGFVCNDRLIVWVGLK